MSSHFANHHEYPARKGNKVETFLGHDEFFNHFQMRCENASSEIWCGISFVEWNLTLPNKQTWWQFFIDLKKKKPSLNIRLLFWRNITAYWNNSALINGDEKDAKFMQQHEINKYLQCKWDESPSDAHCHHAKYYIIDRKYALIGGITLNGQNYFHFMHDTFMEVQGESTVDVVNNFALRWNHNNRYTKCAADEICETTEIEMESDEARMIESGKQEQPGTTTTTTKNGYHHKKTKNGMKHQSEDDNHQQEQETKYDQEVENIRYEKRAVYVIHPRIVKRCYAKLKNLQVTGSEFNGRAIQVQKYFDGKARWKVKICDKNSKKRRRERKGETSPSNDSVNSTDSATSKDERKALGAREENIEALPTSTNGYGYFVAVSRLETGQDERSKDRRCKIGDYVKLRSGKRGCVTHIGPTEFSFGEEVIGIELVSPLDSPHHEDEDQAAMISRKLTKGAGDSGDELKDLENESIDGEKDKELEGGGVSVKICWSCAPNLYPGYKHGSQSIFDEYYRIFQHAQHSIYIESQHPGEYHLLRLIKRKLERDPHFVVFYLVPMWMCNAVRMEKEKSLQYLKNPAAFDKKPRYHEMFTMLSSLKQYKNFCLSGVYHQYTENGDTPNNNKQHPTKNGGSSYSGLSALWNATKSLVCNQVPQYVHSKLCIVDGKWYTLGSANMVDLSMKRDHTELNACVYDQQEAMKLLRKLARLHCQFEIDEEESFGADDQRFEHWNDKQIIGFLSRTAKANVNGLYALDPELYGTTNHAGYFYKTILSRLY